MMIEGNRHEPRMHEVGTGPWALGRAERGMGCENCTFDDAWRPLS